MTERPATRVCSEWRRTEWAALCMLSLCALPAGAWAQSVPPAFHACAAQSDPGRRLACYDREMRRLSQPPARPTNAAAQQASRTPPASAELASSAAAGPAAAAPAQAAAKKPGSSAAASHGAGVWKLFAGSAGSRVTAHVVSLHRWPDAMVLHLDNGQVWRQIGRASGDLSLHPGERVTIEKHLGSYWLSSRYVSDMQVRLETRAR